MALTYDGSNGLFTRLGKIFGMADAVRTHQLDLKTKLEGILAEYTDADMYMIAPLVSSIESRIQQSGLILNDLQRVATDTLVETCYEDSLVSTRQVMPERTLEQALLYLQREMVADSETVDRTTISKAAVAAGASNTGNGTMIFSELVPLQWSAGGTQYPHIRTERLEVRCRRDAQDDAIRSGEEEFEVRGWVSWPNLDYRFPAGSGTRTVLTAVHAGVDAGARFDNQLRNGDFEAFSTANLPDGFTASVGTAGTHFGQETTNFYRGASALKLIGDGSNLTKLRQQLGNTDGTPAKIIADRLYLMTCVVRDNGASTSAGVLRVSLQDGAGTVVSGSDMTASYTQTGTSFTRFYSVFRAPLSLPSTVYAVIELTTALNSGGVMYIDELVLVEMRQIAPGGTGLVVLAGSTDWVVNDTLTLASTNNGEGLMNAAFDRHFDMYGKGIVLPNSTTPTIADGLIS